MDRPSLADAAGARMDRNSQVSGPGGPKLPGESVLFLGPMDLRGGRKLRGGTKDPVQLSPPELDHVEVALPGQGPKKVDPGVDRPDAAHELRIAAPPPGENSVEGLHAPQAALRGRVAFDAGVLQGQGAVGVAKRSGER